MAVAHRTFSKPLCIKCCCKEIMQTDPEVNLESFSPGLYYGLDSCYNVRCTSLIPRQVFNREILKLGEEQKHIGSKTHDEQKIPYLPDEIWLHIFRFVLQSGHYPAMHRLPLVCRRWYELCNDFSLWRTVDLACHRIRWIPYRDQSLEWLSSHHGQSIQEIKLGRWHSLTSEGLKQLAKNCPDLRAVDLTGCYSLGSGAMYSLAEYCKKLRHINLTKTSSDLVSDAAMVHLTQSVGKTLTSLVFGNVPQRGFNCLMNSICENCPNLEQLEVGHCRDRTVTFDVERWQQCLPNIQVLQLRFTRMEVVVVPLPITDSIGWPNLQRLSLAMGPTCGDELEFSMHKSLLERFLRDSSRLEQLDLGHNCDIPASEMLSLNLPSIRGVALAETFWTDEDGVEKFFTKYASQLERIHFETYFLSRTGMRSAVQALIRALPSCLSHLSLRDTAVNKRDVVDIITAIPSLCYVDLRYCSYLPFIWQKTYNAGVDIEQLYSLVHRYSRSL